MLLPVNDFVFLTSLVNNGKLNKCVVCDSAIESEVDKQIVLDTGKCPKCKSEILFYEEEYDDYTSPEILLMEIVTKLAAAIKDQCADDTEFNDYLDKELGVDPELVKACFEKVKRNHLITAQRTNAANYIKL